MKQVKQELMRMESVPEEPSDLEDEGYHTVTRVDYSKKVKF